MYKTDFREKLAALPITESITEARHMIAYCVGMLGQKEVESLLTNILTPDEKRKLANTFFWESQTTAEDVLEL